MNDWSYRALERILDLVGRLGFPLIVCAWAATAAAVVAMARVIRRTLRPSSITPPLVVGLLSLAAHLLDYFGTLAITPDLAAEANPIWRIVVERLGLTAARWYGLTGKVMLAVLSFEFFAYYLAGRGRLLPAAARNILDFWKKYGSDVRPWDRLANFFAFLFALIGPFCFYIALLNACSGSRFYDRLPAMPVALAGYIFVLALGYLAGNYLSWRARRGNKP